MTATLIGPGGRVEVDNDVGNPLPVAVVGVLPPVGGEVDLSPATLAALETITVLVAAGQEIGLSPATLAALENITVAISSGTVELGAVTLAALESITVTLAGGSEVSLSAATLAALEVITAAVSNFPADYPDAGASVLLTAILAAVDTLEANTTGLATQATLASLAADVANGVGVTGPLTDAELRTSPVPVSGTVTVAEPVTVDATDLDIRNLVNATDSVRSIDAAELQGLLYAPINFATAGANTIVVVNPGQRLRLHRFLPTMASVPDATGDPVLTFTLGSKSIRGQVLSGRFDILGDDGEDLIITSSKTGQIDGTVAYKLETT